MQQGSVHQVGEEVWLLFVCGSERRWFATGLPVSQIDEAHRLLEAICAAVARVERREVAP